jgi:hypothetical protein
MRRMKRMPNPKLRSLSAYILSFLLLISACSIKAQNQELQVGLYNIGLGAVIGGVGSLINKPKTEKPLQAVWRGIKYGALGGTGMYLGKKITYQINNGNSLWYAWPSKILHNAASSIVENAAAHKKNVFNQWNFTIGFIRLGMNTEDRIRVSARVMPIAFTNFIVACTKTKFLATESLQYGTPVFEYKSTDEWAKVTRAGVAANLMYVVDTLNADKYYVYAHEHIHVLQIREYHNINTWFKPIFERSKIRDSKFMKTLSKYLYPDIPYNYALYVMLYQKGDCYFNNLFEFEAERFATNQMVVRCK